MRLCTHEAQHIVEGADGDLGQLAEMLAIFGHHTMIDTRFRSRNQSGFCVSVTVLITLSDEEHLLGVQHELVLQSYTDDLLLEAMLEGVERCLFNLALGWPCSCASSRRALRIPT